VRCRFLNVPPRSSAPQTGSHVNDSATRRSNSQCSSRPTCGAAARTGATVSRAERRLGREAPFCFVHDPAKRELAAEAQHLGGLRRRRDKTLRRVYNLGGITTIPEIRRYLEVGLTDTLALDNSVLRNRVLFAGVMAASKLLEVGELTDEVRAIRAELDRPAADAAADDPERSA